MTIHTLIGLAAASAAVLTALPVSATVPPRERAESALREAVSSEDGGLRRFALEKALAAPAADLQAGARLAAASADRVERSLALELLARIDVSGNRALFVEALGSPYRSVRLRALVALESLSDRSLSPRLVEVLEQDPDPDLRALAARALGRAGAAEAREALQGAVESGHPVVQTAATQALVALGDLGAGRLLLERARAASGSERRRLFGLVALVPDAGLVPALTELLEDSDREVRVGAAAAILSILGPSR